MKLSLLTFLITTAAAFNDDVNHHSFKEFTIIPPHIKKQCQNSFFVGSYHKKSKDACEDLYKRACEESIQLSTSSLVQKKQVEDNLKIITYIFDQFDCYANENIPAEHRKFVKDLEQMIHNKKDDL